MQDKTPLTDIAARQVAAAKESSSGISAAPVVADEGFPLRQTVVAVAGGKASPEHDNPGSATVLVLQGEVRITWAGGELTGSQGDLLVVPPARHVLHAVSDAAVLQSAVTGVAQSPVAGEVG